MSLKIEKPENFKNFLAGDFKKICFKNDDMNFKKQKQFNSSKVKTNSKGKCNFKTHRTY